MQRAILENISVTTPLHNFPSLSDPLSFLLMYQIVRNGVP